MQMANGALPKVTFGTIVLNGEPFTRYCLRGLYPFAHEIVVVEGACEDASAIATPDGHSTDATLQSLHRFKKEEDPEGKVTIIRREGFWPEKDEQSRAYAERATGDYLWQVDIDEFYKAEDMKTVLNMLRDDPKITAASFRQITFWGGFDYVTDGWYHQRGAGIYHRLFKWAEGYRYVTHRLPTVADNEGRNLRTIRWLDATTLARKDIFLYHYALVFPKQVFDKCAYYSRKWPKRFGAAREWAEQSFLRLDNPYRPHNVYQFPSWIERFQGTHPDVIRRLIHDIEEGKVAIELRRTDDIDRLLRSRSYRANRAILKTAGLMDAWLRARRNDVLRAMPGLSAHPLRGRNA